VDKKRFSLSGRYGNWNISGGLKCKGFVFIIPTPRRTCGCGEVSLFKCNMGKIKCTNACVGDDK